MKRNQYSSAFKFKVAIEAIKGDLTIAELMKKHKVHSSQIHKWKRQLLDNGSGVYDGKINSQTDQSPDPEITRLHNLIGRMQVEKDFLSHALSQ